MNTDTLATMPLGEATLQAYGDEFATSSDIEQMIPNWHAATMILEKCGLVVAIDNILPSDKTAQELVAAAALPTFAGKHMLPVIESLRDFAGSVTRLRERAAALPGDPILAIRTAATPPMRWDTTDGPLHPWIVLAALAQLPSKQ